MRIPPSLFGLVLAFGLLAFTMEAAEPVAVHTGTVAARIEVPRGAERPREVEVRFAPPPRQGHQGKVGGAKGTVVCPVGEAGAVRCDVPAGVADLRLHARGFAAVYRWGVAVAAGEVADLGALALVPGASVVGFVETADGAPLGRSARVVLVPLHSGAMGPEQQQSIERMSLAAAPDERGFFQLRDVAPGSYALEATADGLARARHQPLEVLEGLEARLAQPLVLSPPATLEIAITPPATPSGALWRLQLSRLVRRGRLEEVATGEAGLDGRWRSQGLETGTYRVTVESSSWWRAVAHDVEVEPGLSPLAIDLPLVEVEGVLKGVDEPSAASVWFGGVSGFERVGLVPDHTGRFTGVLPREGEWRVQILRRRGERPRTLAPVEVRRAPGQRVARVELELPDTHIVGRVVDERGKAVGEAEVSASGMGKLLGRRDSVPTDGDGEFTFEGLAPGLYRVTAKQGDAVSDVFDVQVEKGRAHPELQLVLQEQARVVGAVVSARGPVPGAAVEITPDLSSLRRLKLGVTHRLTTDVLGRFEARVPAATTGLSLVVLPPGFAARLLAAPVQPEKPVEIAVEATGGTLVLDLASLAELMAETGDAWLTPRLLHGGAEAALDVLRQWADLHGAPQPQGIRAGTWVLPMMEPGEYRLCVELVERSGPGAASVLRPLCASGHLHPGGELVLALPAG